MNSLTLPVGGRRGGGSLTAGLHGRAVRVAQGHQGRLHQLREEHVPPHQHKLSVAVSMALGVAGSCPAHIGVLHHAVDWDHQAFRRERRGGVGVAGEGEG